MHRRAAEYFEPTDERDVQIEYSCSSLYSPSVEAVIKIKTCKNFGQLRVTV
jgi:hypothetical protein